MLMHWADRVGLLRSDYDRRLDASNAQDAVFRTLACVRSLLGDATRLKTMYGVRTFPIGNSAGSRDTVDTTLLRAKQTIGSIPRARLVAELDKVRLRIKIPAQTSLKNKFRWAVRDKQLFERFT